MPQPSLASRVSSPSQGKFLTLLALFLCCLGIVLLRVLTFDEPLERDQTIYAVAAHEILSGRPLYSDIWDIKPPAIYFTYAAAELVAGYGRMSIYLLGVGAAIATLTGVYGAVKTMTGDRVAALWAAIFWVLVGSDMRLQANQPNSEVFINALLVWGLFFLARAYTRPDRAQNDDVRRLHFNLWGAGACWGAATLFKQVAFMVPLLLAFLLVFVPPRPHMTRRARLGAFSALLFPTLALWAATFAYFAATGRGGIFYWTLFEYGPRYAAESGSVLATLPLWRRLVPPYIEFLWPLLGLCSVGLAVGLSTQKRQLFSFWPLLAACAIALPIAIALPGQYFPHYYQLWLPTLCIAAGLGLGQWRRRPTRSLGAFGTATIAAALLFVSQWPNWKLAPEDFSTQKYNNAFFVHLKIMAGQVDSILRPEETFYQYGYDPGFYFETKRRPPTGVLVLGLPYSSMPPPWFLRRILADLKREKPEMVILDAYFPPTLVTYYIQREYVLIRGELGKNRLLVLARRDGALIRRLAAP